MLQWARANACPWDIVACMDVAHCGHLEMLWLARAKGYPWTTDAYARAGRHHEVLPWLHANGCPEVDETFSVLFTAAENGDEAIVRTCIKAGADVNEEVLIQRESCDGKVSSLYVAIENGHEAVVRALIQAGAAVNDTEFLSSPLYEAALKGHEAIVRALIQAGADVNKADESGRTPLICAAGDGHEALVRMLIDAGANVNQVDHNGRTPLSCSLEPVSNVTHGRHAAVVQILRDAGAVLHPHLGW